MERFQIKPSEWEEMSKTEEGQYSQAELMEYITEKRDMAAWEHHVQEEEYHRKYGRK